MASKVTVRFSKKFEPHVPGEGAILERIGTTHGLNVRKRITGRNVDAGGRPIAPLVARRRYVAADSEIGRKVAKRDRNAVRRAGAEGRQNRAKQRDGDVVREYVGPKGGDRSNPDHWQTRVVVMGGYPAVKKAEGKRPIRDLNRTGKLWKSLSASIMGGGRTKSGRLKDRKIKVYFRGSDKTRKYTVKSGKYAGKVRSLPMKDKAQYAFYGRGRKSSAADDRDQLLAPSKVELDGLRDLYIKAIQLFR